MNEALRVGNVYTDSAPCPKCDGTVTFYVTVDVNKGPQVNSPAYCENGHSFDAKTTIVPEVDPSGG